MGKCKANELDSSDSGGLMDPSTRRPAPRLMPGAGSAPLPTKAGEAPAIAPEKSTGEKAASSRWKLSYAEVSKTSGALKPTAKGTGTAALPAASKQASPRRTSGGPSGRVSGPLSGTPKDTILTSDQVKNRVPPRGTTQ
jgi:hypothetical protein